MTNFTFPTGNINGNPSPARNVFLLAAANDVSKTGSLLISDVLGQMQASDITNVLTYGTVTSLASSDTILVYQGSTRSKIALSDMTKSIGLGTPTTQTAAYSVAASDNNQLILYSSSSAANITLGNIAVGMEVEVCQVGTGQFTLVAGSGITVTARSGAKSAGQGSIVGAIQISTSQWIVQGDTTT